MGISQRKNSPVRTAKKVTKVTKTHQIKGFDGFLFSGNTKNAPVLRINKEILEIKSLNYPEVELYFAFVF
jgi:hypothetical protein